MPDIIDAEVMSMRDFAALVMADAALAARLAAIEDGAGFIAEANRCARAHGIVLSATSQSAAEAAAALGLARWSPPALAGSALPPRDWLPIAVAAQSDAVAVDWAWFGAEALRTPFSDHEIRR